MAGFFMGAGRLIMGAYDSLPEINAATLSGAIDIVVVEQDDGSLLSSPFHIRFGRFKVLRKPRDRIVKIIVNDQPCDFVMRLGPQGEAHFLEETDEKPPEEEMVSPMLSPRADQGDSGSNVTSPSLPATPVLSPDAIKPQPDPPGGVVVAPKDGTPKSWSWTWGRLPKQIDGEGNDLLSEALEQQLFEEAFPDNLHGREGDGEDGSDQLQEMSLVAGEGSLAGGGGEGGEGGEGGDGEMRPFATPPAVEGLQKLSILLAEGPGGDWKEEGAGGTPESAAGEKGPRQEKQEEEEVVAQEKKRGDKEKEEEDRGEGDVERGGGGEEDLGGTSESPTLRSGQVMGLGAGGGGGPSDSELGTCSSVASTPPPDLGLRLMDDALVKTRSSLQDTFQDLEDAQEEDESEPVTRRFLLQLIQQSLSTSEKAEPEPEETLPSTTSPSVQTPREVWGEVGEDGEDVGQGDAWEGLDAAQWGAMSQGKIMLSMCGREISTVQGIREQRKVFMRHRVSADVLKQQANDIATSADLCVAVKGFIYRWQVFAPALMSSLCLEEDLPLQYHHQLLEAFPTDRKFQAQREALWGAAGDDSQPDHLLGLESGESIFLGDRSEKLSKGKYYRKTLTPSSEQLRCLPLRPGANTIRFHISNKASVEPVSASIFLWKAHDRVVISDVDGTITKSDALGHLLPRVGIQWLQKGVPQLLSAIQANDYRILYLTARPIGQVDATKAYLQTVKEDGVHLPLGPVITSPDGLFKSLNREVIQRRPEEFKIQCLMNIQKLFAPKPFYAGFGNKGTDAVSYRAVDVPDSRILIINPQGEIHNELNQAYTTSYDSLRELVDLMFPFVPTKSVEEQPAEDYSAFSYWKLPGLPEQEDPDAKTENQKK